MRITFGTPRDCTASALNSFSKALEAEKYEAKGRFAVDAIFSDAMRWLFGVRIASGHSMSEEELIEFKSRVVQLIGAEPDNLFRYIYDSFDCVWSSPNDGWDDACMRRSAIQLLLDEFPGGAALFSTEDRDYWMKSTKLSTSASGSSIPCPTMTSLLACRKTIGGGGFRRKRGKHHVQYATIVRSLTPARYDRPNRSGERPVSAACAPTGRNDTGIRGWRADRSPGVQATAPAFRSAVAISGEYAFPTAVGARGSQKLRWTPPGASPVLGSAPASSCSRTAARSFS